MDANSTTYLASPLLIVNIDGKEVKIKDFIGKITGHDYCLKGVKNSKTYRSKYLIRIPFIKKDYFIRIFVKKRSEPSDRFIKTSFLDDGLTIEFSFLSALEEVIKDPPTAKQSQAQDQPKPLHPEAPFYKHLSYLRKNENRFSHQEFIQLFGLLLDIRGHSGYIHHKNNQLFCPDFKLVFTLWNISHNTLENDPAKSEFLNYIMEYYTEKTSNILSE